MPKLIHIQIERLPEGVFLATSPDVPGLTVEADSREEAERVAPEVAVELYEFERGPLSDRAIFSFTFK